MRELSVFDIIGPIMIGPSSSHTAGALKIARIARKLAKSRITSVRFQLYGSFATTYKGHGSDRAFVGGILGFETDDYRIRDSFDWAQKSGIEVIFEEMENDIDSHPNTVDITVTEEDGRVSSIRGASVGGGIAVPQMIVAADDIARLGHLPHEGIVAGDMLGHAVEDMEDSDGIFGGEVDLTREIVDTITGRDGIVQNIHFSLQ
jgi:iron-sulfur-dependent L-serine dehydratase beta subunit